jgi:3-oxoadipate enol-lactonase
MRPFTVTAPTATLSAFRDGEGTPLLLVMGVAGHHRVWGLDFLDRLTEQHDVVMYDQRGIGASSWVDEPFTLDDLAADALAVMDEVGWDDAHVVGFSMGGAIAQLLALDHPARVRTLTLIGTWGDSDHVWGDKIGLLAGAGRAEDTATAERMLFEANVSPAFAADARQRWRFTGAAASVKVPGPVVGMQMTAAAVHDVSRRLGSLDVPTLVVHGTQDGIIRTAAGERLAAAIPDARLLLLEGAGHHVAWERPEETASAVLAHTG